MQSLADHIPNNNTLYQNVPQLSVNRDSHEQKVQALILVITLTKGTNPILNHTVNLTGLERGL